MPYIAKNSDSGIVSNQVLEACANRRIEDGDTFSYFQSNFNLVGVLAVEIEFFNGE